MPSDYINEDIQPIIRANKHLCESHHIQSGYMGNYRYIITGSEENLIYIYNALDGEQIRYYMTNSTAVPIISPLPDSQGLGFIYCGLHTNNFHQVKPISPESTNKNGTLTEQPNIEEVSEAINLMGQIIGWGSQEF